MDLPKPWCILFLSSYNRILIVTFFNLKFLRRRIARSRAIFLIIDVLPPVQNHLTYQSWFKHNKINLMV